MDSASLAELESWRVGELERYLPAPALAPSQTCGQGIPELMVMALSKVPIAQTKKRPKRCVCCSPFTEKLASNFAVICEIDM